MAKKTNIFSMLSEQKKRACLESIIALFRDEFEEEIGMITAEEVFDAIIEPTFSSVYNRGIQDAQQTLQERIADVQVDLDLLLRE